MQGAQNIEVTASPELEEMLNSIRRRLGLPNNAAVYEWLVAKQIEASVYSMTGIKRGPRLAVDNTHKHIHKDHEHGDNGNDQTRPHIAGTKTR